MRKSILAIVAVAALAFAAPAALADNGTTGGTGSGGSSCQSGTTSSIDTSQVQSDISKLDTDVQTRHDDLDADIQAVTTAAQGSASADTLKADRQKTQSDFQANESVVKQDRSQLESDAKGLMGSVAKGCGARKSAHGQLATLRQSARKALQTELVQFRQENQQLRNAAKQAVQQDRGRHKGHGGQTTTTTGG